LDHLSVETWYKSIRHRPRGVDDEMEKNGLILEAETHNFGVVGEFVNDLYEASRWLWHVVNLWVNECKHRVSP